MKNHLRLITSSIAMAFAMNAGAVSEEEINDGFALANALVGPVAVVTGSLPKDPNSNRYDIDFFEFTTSDTVKDIKIRVKSCEPTSGGTTAALLIPGVKRVKQQFFAASSCFDDLLALTVPANALATNQKYVIALTTGSVTFNANGDGGYIWPSGQMARDYEMTVTGLPIPAPAEIEVETVIKPNQGQGDSSHINLKSKGTVRFAILDGGEKYDVTQIDPASLKFGHNGTEDSVKGCDKHLTDVNGDGKGDLVCRFDVNYTGLTTSSKEAALKGKMKDGKSIKDQPIKIKVTASDEK